MVKAAAGQKIKYIDLGKGLSLYKKRFMSSGIPVAKGVLEMPSMRNRLNRWRNELEQWSRESSLNPLFLIPGRAIRHMKRKKRYE